MTSPVFSGSSVSTILAFGHQTVAPGEATSVSGGGCPAGAVVTISVNGVPVASTTADAQGSFSASINPSEQGAGQLTVTATCGSRRLTSVLDVVSTANLSNPDGSAGVFGGFLLLGFVLFRQFSSNATARRRRRSAADVLEEEQGLI